MRANIESFFKIKKDTDCKFVLIHGLAYEIQRMYYIVFGGFSTLEAVLMFIKDFVSVKVVNKLDAHNFF